MSEHGLIVVAPDAMCPCGPTIPVYPRADAWIVQLTEDMMPTAIQINDALEELARSEGKPLDQLCVILAVDGLQCYLSPKGGSVDQLREALHAVTDVINRGPAFVIGACGATSRFRTHSALAARSLSSSSRRRRSASARSQRPVNRSMWHRWAVEWNTP